MRILGFKDFMEKNNLIDDTMNEFQLQKIYIYQLYLRDSKKFSIKEIVNIDDGSQCGTHWRAFDVKNNKSIFFDNLGGQPDKVLLNQLPEPILNLIYKIQDKKPQICGSYCLYFFYLIERTIFYDAI